MRPSAGHGRRRRGLVHRPGRRPITSHWSWPQRRRRRRHRRAVAGVDRGRAARPLGGFVGVPWFAARIKGNGLVRDFRLRGEPWDSVLGLVRRGRRRSWSCCPCSTSPSTSLFDKTRTTCPRWPASSPTGPPTRSACILLVLIVGIGAPIVEEIFYRGLLFRSMENRFGTWPAIVGSGVIFGASHFQPLQFLGLAAVRRGPRLPDPPHRPPGAGHLRPHGVQHGDRHRAGHRLTVARPTTDLDADEARDRRHRSSTGHRRPAEPDRARGPSATPTTTWRRPTTSPARADRDVPRRHPGRGAAPHVHTIVDVVVVAACVGFVLWHLQPDLLLRNTTPAGGDMGAHVWGPAYLRDHLLPHGQVAGWIGRLVRRLPRVPVLHGAPVAARSCCSTPGSTAPPAFVPAVAGIVALGAAAAFWSRRAGAATWRSSAPVVALRPGRTALRRGVQAGHGLGVVTLPVCAYAFGRLAGTRFPTPGRVLGGDAAVPLLPGLHDLRRQHPVDAGRRVRVLDLAQPGAALPRGGVQGPRDRPVPGPGRGAAGRSPGCATSSRRSGRSAPPRSSWRCGSAW